MTIPLAHADQIGWYAETFERLVDNVSVAVLGKKHVVSLAVTALAAGGHLLLEDVPGTGKTSLARALANSVQCTHNRVQFTPDSVRFLVTAWYRPRGWFSSRSPPRNGPGRPA